jgi:hypothetical protein
MNMTGDTLVDIRSTDHIKIGYNSGVVCASTEIHGASVDIAGTTEIAGQLTATYYTVMKYLTAGVYLMNGSAASFYMYPISRTSPDLNKLNNSNG